MCQRDGAPVGRLSLILYKCYIELVFCAAQSNPDAPVSPWPAYIEGNDHNFTGATGASTAGILDRKRIIAKPGFNRWLVPPAALAIHLCIGMAYGFSVFWLPLSRAVGTETGTKVPACAGNATTFWDKTIGTVHALSAA
jgi:hypothetical protein